MLVDDADGKDTGVMLDVRSAMRRSASFHRDLIAVASGGQRLTYEEAWRRGVQLANGLLSLGLGPGDRIAVLEDNSIEASDFFIGTAVGNLVRVPLYKRNSTESHAHMLRNTECKAVVVAEEYAHELEGLETDLPTLEHVIVRDARYEAWLAEQSDADPDIDVSLDDFYVIRHSAGTTGIPKGISFTHGAWMRTERDWTYLLPPIELGDHCTHVGPISHGSGYLFLPIWLAGGCNVLEPKFAADRVLALLHEVGGYAFAVPTMVADLLAAATGLGPPQFAQLKALVISGAPIRRQTALAARDLFGPRLYQMYGQTECVPVAFMGPKEWFGALTGSDPLEAVGRVMPFAELEIRGDDGTALPAGEPGEIAVRNDGQMVKIWNDPDLTAARLVNGWVLTGDIGTLDANGFLYLRDRKDDLIISGGFNIWPAELEIVIAELHGVREVAVFGVPHDRWGETPMAIVVVDEAAKISEGEIMTCCRERLGSYKRPSIVRIQTEPLPRTPVGKVSRKALREPFWENRDARTT